MLKCDTIIVGAGIVTGVISLLLAASVIYGGSLTSQLEETKMLLRESQTVAALCNRK